MDNKMLNRGFNSDESWFKKIIEIKSNDMIWFEFTELNVAWN